MCLLHYYTVYHTESIVVFASRTSFTGVSITYPQECGGSPAFGNETQERCLVGRTEHTPSICALQCSFNNGSNKRL